MTVETPKPRQMMRASKIAMSVRLKAYQLYVVQGLQPREVAPQTGLTLKQVRELVIRQGWTKTRNSITAQVLSRAPEQVAEIVESTAQLSELGAIKTLERAVERAGEKDPDAAKDTQAFSQAAKNLTGLYRQARGMDVAAAGSSAAIGLFVVSVGSVAREEKVVSAEPIQAAAAPTEAFEF